MKGLLDIILNILVKISIRIEFNIFNKKYSFN
jgi:hypothetical protein